MTPAQTTELLRLLPRHYGPWGVVRITAEPLFWAALAPFPPEVALAALHQWVRWHAGTPPTPQELARQCQFEARVAAKDASHA
jgi:hypothetical protein